MRFMTPIFIGDEVYEDYEGCKLSVGPELVSGFNVVVNSFNAVVIKDL